MDRTTFSIQIQTRDPALERPREVNRLSALNPGLPLIQTQPVPRPGPNPDPGFSGQSLNGFNKIQDPVAVQNEPRTFTSSATFSVSLQDLTRAKTGLNQDLKPFLDPGKSKVETQVPDPRPVVEKPAPEVRINGISAFTSETSRETLIWNSPDLAKSSNKSDLKVLKSPSLLKSPVQISSPQRSPVLVHSPEKPVHGLEFNKNLTVLLKPEVIQASPVHLQEFHFGSNVESRTESRTRSIPSGLGLDSQKNCSDEKSMKRLISNGAGIKDLEKPQMFLQTPAEVPLRSRSRSPLRKESRNNIRVLLEPCFSPVQMNFDLKRTLGSQEPAADQDQTVKNHFPKSPTQNRKHEAQTKSRPELRTLSSSLSPVLDLNHVSEARRSLSWILESQMKTQTQNRPRSYYGLTPTEYQAYGGIQTKTNSGPGLDSGLGLEEDQSETESEPRTRPTGERPGPNQDWTTVSLEPALDLFDRHPQTGSGLDWTQTQVQDSQSLEPGLDFDPQTEHEPDQSNDVKLDFSESEQTKECHSLIDPEQSLVLESGLDSSSGLGME